MVPLQFILLLVIANLPASLNAASAPPTTAPATVAFPWSVLTSALLTHAALLFFVWRKARLAVRELHIPTASTTAVTQRMDDLLNRARWATLLITAVHLFSSTLPDAVYTWLNHSHLPRGTDGQVPLIPELLFMSPAILTWLAMWTLSYFVQSASRERGLPYQLAREAPVHEMPSLAQYLSMQARHNFFPLLFLVLEALVIACLGFVIPKLPRTSLTAVIIDHADAVSTIASTLLVLLILPTLLVRLWHATPLRGPLRQRLDRAASLHRLRFRNILIWRTHAMVINAAILGWVPFARYFLMSDALIEAFSDRQLESVFAHEVGHGVHRHIPWYLATMIAACALATGLTGLAMAALPFLVHLSVHTTDQIEQGLGFTIVGLCVALLLPFVSRRFEHQADFFAIRYMARMLKEYPEPRDALIATVPVGATHEIPPAFPLAATPGPAESLTIDHYRAGHYPHAASAPPSLAQAAFAAESAPTLSPAFSAIAPATPSAPLTPDQAGAEIFISALDAIVDPAHRSRNSAGLMHPSINGRIALLRQLATDPLAVQRFNRRMRWTRLIIVAVAAGGIALAMLADTLSPKPAAPTPSTLPTASHAAR